jgi:hypothetical protein
MLTVGCTLLLIGLSRAVAAQTTAVPPPRAHGQPRVPVTVALQDTATAAPGFRILRRVDQHPRDVILLTGPADAETLSKAVRHLLRVRMVAGDTAARTGEVRVRRLDSGAQTAQRPYPWAERVVRDLHAAPPQEISGVGAVRAVQIWFPPQHHRTNP